METTKVLEGIAGMGASTVLIKDYMKVAEKINEVAKEAKLSANRAIKGIHNYCRENPIKVAGAAAGGGALLSYILIRKFSRK